MENVNKQGHSDSVQLLFDKMWFKITKDSQQEYILGSQFKKFVIEMNNYAFQHLGHDIISEDIMKSVNSFSETNPETKIQKYTLDDFLRSLVGFNFKEYAYMVGCDKEEVSDMRESVNGDFSSELPQVSRSQETFHDEDYYKTKFELLKKEHEYCKKRLLSEREKQSKLNDKSTNTTASVDYEFLVSEFQKQITEQRNIILNITKNIESRNIESKEGQKILNNKDNKDNKGKDFTYTVITSYLYIIFQILLICFIAIIFSYSMSRIIFPMNGVSDYEEFSGYDDNDGINNHMGISFETVSWWEKYETLSHMVYRLQEWYSDFISSWFGNNNNNNNIYSNAYSQLTNPPDTSTSNNDIDPYNQIFGL